MFSRYPAFDSVIARKRKDGIDTVPIAVELLAGALSDIVYRSLLPLEEATAIEDYIFGKTDEITAVDGRLTEKQRHELAALLRAFLFNCGMQKDIGQIDEQMYIFATTEVVGALRSLDADERSKQRMLKSLYGALFPPERPAD